MSRTHRRSGAPRLARRSSALPFAISTHAIERFRERVAPGLTWGKARHELRILAASAQRTEHRTPLGQEVWLATDGEPVRMIVKLDAGLRTCVTVLAPAKVGEGVDVEADEDVA